MWHRLPPLGRFGDTGQCPRPHCGAGFSSRHRLTFHRAGAHGPSRQSPAPFSGLHTYIPPVSGLCCPSHSPRTGRAVFLAPTPIPQQHDIVWHISDVDPLGSVTPPVRACTGSILPHLPLQCHPHTWNTLKPSHSPPQPPHIPTPHAHPLGKCTSHAFPFPPHWAAHFTHVAISPRTTGLVRDAPPRFPFGLRTSRTAPPPRVIPLTPPLPPHSCPRGRLFGCALPRIAALLVPATTDLPPKPWTYRVIHLRFCDFACTCTVVTAMRRHYPSRTLRTRLPGTAPCTYGFPCQDACHYLCCRTPCLPTLPWDPLSCPHLPCRAYISSQFPCPDIYLPPLQHPTGLHGLTLPPLRPPACPTTWWVATPPSHWAGSGNIPSSSSTTSCGSPTPWDCLPSCPGVPHQAGSYP